MNIPPSHIVLSGGGIRGVAYVGVFLELEKRGFLKNIKHILGVSCGAMFGFSYILGYSPDEMFSLASSLDFSLLQNIDPDVALNYFVTYGIDDGTNLDKFLESLVKNKGLSKNINFQELYEKTSLVFRCFAVDLNTCVLKEFSYKLTPNYSVLLALRASMCIPGYFIPVVDDDKLYVDGGILNNFPIDLLTIEEQHTTLGFTFSEHPNIERINSLEEYLYQIIACSYLVNGKEIKENTIILPCGEFPLWKFHASYEERIYLIETGRKAVEDFFLMKGKKPLRRYSVS